MSTCAIHNRAESVEHGLANPLALEVGLDSNRTKMPVWFRRIPPSPLADPIQDAKRGCNRVADHRGWKNSCLFDRVGLAIARARHSADTNEPVRENGPKNESSPIESLECGYKETSHGDRAMLAIRNMEHLHVRGIVTHSSADELCGLFEFSAAQQAQLKRVRCGHRRFPGKHL